MKNIVDPDQKPADNDLHFLKRVYDFEKSYVLSVHG